MVHRSGFAGFIIDCETGDVASAADFWSEALGNTRKRKPEGRYVLLDDEAGLHVEVQKVTHPSRIHIDIATDDIPAEVARLERLGARTVSRVRTWVVMEAPTGHRFCVIPAPEGGFTAHANVWDTPPDT